MGKRYYDPIGGRFISPDPLGHEASMDLYSYANGDPVNFVDPTGRAPETADPPDADSNGSVTQTNFQTWDDYLDYNRGRYENGEIGRTEMIANAKASRLVFANNGSVSVISAHGMSLAIPQFQEEFVPSETPGEIIPFPGQGDENQPDSGSNPGAAAFGAFARLMAVAKYAGSTTDFALNYSQWAIGTAVYQGLLSPEAAVATYGNVVSSVNTDSRSVVQKMRTAANTVLQGVFEYHGNDSRSGRPQHGYEIYNGVGAIMKVGISGQPLNVNGSSPRANVQVSQLNALNSLVGYMNTINVPTLLGRVLGPGPFTANVVARSLPNRSVALQWEYHRVVMRKAQGHDLPLQFRPVVPDF